MVGQFGQAKSRVGLSYCVTAQPWGATHSAGWLQVGLNTHSVLGAGICHWGPLCPELSPAQILSKQGHLCGADTFPHPEAHFADLSSCSCHGGLTYPGLCSTDASPYLDQLQPPGVGTVSLNADREKPQRSCSVLFIADRDLICTARGTEGAVHFVLKQWQAGWVNFTSRGPLVTTKGAEVPAVLQRLTVE